MEPYQPQQPQQPPQPNYQQPPQANWPPAPVPVGAYPPRAPATSGLAIASFVMAILGLIGVPILCSILAIVFGNMAIKEIDASDGSVTGRGLARAGVITGYVPLFIVGGALVIAAVVLGIAGIVQLVHRA
jgi:hypothetical protein